MSSALIDVIDLVPRQDDSEGQQDKHPGNGPPGVPPLRADRRTSESRLGRRVHFLLVMGCPVHAPLVLGPTAWRRGRMMDRSLSLLLMILISSPASGVVSTSYVLDRRPTRGALTNTVKSLFEMSSCGWFSIVARSSRQAKEVRGYHCGRRTRIPRVRILFMLYLFEFFELNNLHVVMTMVTL